MQVKICSNPTAYEGIAFRCRRGSRKSKCALPFRLWVYFAYVRSEESVLSSPPCFKTMYEYIINRTTITLISWTYIVGCPASLLDIMVRITWRTPLTTKHEQTRGGACCKRPWQRGTDASLTCFFGLVATCDVRGTWPTQKTTAILQSHPNGTTKTNLVFRRPSDRGGILKSS